MTDYESYPPLTRAEKIEAAYSQEGFDLLLRSFAFNEPVSMDNDRVATEGDIDESIQRFSHVVAELSLQDGVVETQVVKTAFNRLLLGINDVATEKFGRQEPVTIWRVLMFKIGLQEPQSLIYFSGVGDRYWDVRFSNELKEERGIRRVEGEDDVHYLQRHISRSFQDFVLAPFSHIQLATSAYASLAD